MLFDGAQAELPTATLLTSASQARHRVITGHLHRWLADRWSWLRPRTVPIIVAFAGMVAVLGSMKYLAVYAPGDVSPARSGRMILPNPLSHDAWAYDKAPRHQGVSTLERPDLMNLTITQPDRK